MFMKICSGLKNNKEALASVAHEPKGCQFGSWSGHMPRLPTRFPVGGREGGSKLISLIYLSFSLSVPLSLKSLKTFFKKELPCTYFRQYKLATKRDSETPSLSECEYILFLLMYILMLNALTSPYRDEKIFSWVFSQPKFTKLTKI